MGMSRQIKRQIERNQLRSSTAPIGSFTCPQCGKRGTLTRGAIRKDHVKCGICGYRGRMVKAKAKAKPNEDVAEKQDKAKLAASRKHID